jgi:hypothetical protein
MNGLPLTLPGRSPCPPVRGPIRGSRLILDTNVLIAYERGTIERASLDVDELAIAAVTVVEYRAGIELPDSAERAADRARAPWPRSPQPSTCLSTPKRPLPAMPG